VSTTNVRVYTHIVTNEPIDSLHLVIDFPKLVQLAFKHPSTIIFQYNMLIIYESRFQVKDYTIEYVPC